MTSTQLPRTRRAEDLAIALYRTRYPDRSVDSWQHAHPIIRNDIREQAERLLDHGYLQAMLDEHERELRDQIAAAITRTVPASPPGPGSLHRAHHRAAIGALHSAATIARGRPA